MNANQVAQRLNVTMARLRQLRIDGRIVGELHGRDYWYSEEAVAAYEATLPEGGHRQNRNKPAEGRESQSVV